MSQKEIHRLEVLEKLLSKQLSQLAAADLLGMSTRHLRRLQHEYKLYGAAVLVSKKRGKASNNQLCPKVKALAISLIQECYADFGPTLAHEKLTEQHQLNLSVESVRQLMLKNGLWRGKKRKVIQTHQMRVRRSCLGELIQIDGSPHAWFEDRGPRCCLLVFVDDATGRIMMLHFEEEESTQGYFDATYQYILAYGLANTFYSDKHGIFRVNIREAEEGTGETQFSRALKTLDIQLINAHSPQAKGRVENKNGTLQDRLVKELRLRKINDIQTANQFLPEFIQDYNKRFAKPAASPVDAHRPLKLSKLELRKILSHHYERTITKNLEVHYKNNIYQIQTKTPSYAMRKAKVLVQDDRGEVTLIYKDKPLAYEIFDKNNATTPVANTKQINQYVDKKAKEIKKAQPRPAPNHPWRESACNKITPQNPPQSLT